METMNLSMNVSTDCRRVLSQRCLGDVRSQPGYGIANVHNLWQTSFFGRSSILTRCDRWRKKDDSLFNKIQGPSWTNERHPRRDFLAPTRKQCIVKAFAFSAYGENGDASTTQLGRYNRVGECLVYPQFPRSRSPKGIIQFLGGAFIGASPDITYSHFIELLAKEGFIIVAVPHNITFDHTAQARGIYKRFNDGLDILYKNGVPRFGLDPDEISKLPIYSVGHSNGALMQVLIGCLCTDLPGKLPKANAIISFNNKPAADAVPFFDQMGPTLLQAMPLIESSPFTTIASNFAAEALKAVQSSSIPLPPGVDSNDLQSVQRFFEQIPSVFGQVRDGVSEFTPTPQENRETVSIKYAIPNNLLIKFTVDSIVETDLLESP